MLEHDVVKRYSLKIDRRPVTKTADDVWMTHAIQRHSFILKILNQGTFELRVLIALQKNIERFDYNLTKALVGGAAIARDINLGITAASKTFFNVVTTVDPAL